MTIVNEKSDGVKWVEFEEGFKIDEGKVRQHVEKVVRQSVKETRNGFLDAEADELCGLMRYERSIDRLDTRAGHHERMLQTRVNDESSDGADRVFGGLIGAAPGKHRK